MKNIMILTDKLTNQGIPTNGMRIGKALKNLGHKVIHISHENLTPLAILWADLILAFGTLLYPSRVSQAMKITKIKKKQTIFALWYFDACNPKFSHSKHKYEAMRKVAPHLDWLIMTDHSYPWEKHAKRFLHLMQGIDPDDFALTPSGPTGRKYDVIFTGGFKEPFNDRKAILNAIAKRFSLIIYGRDSSRRVYEANFFQAYQQARVAFVPAPPKIVAHNYWSNRIYLAAATGTPCVVGYVPGLEKHYMNEKEVLFFHNTKEAIDAIRFLVNSPQKAWDMGMTARTYTLRDHTYENRAKDLMEAIFGKE